MDNGKARVDPDAFLSRVEFGAHQETVDHVNRKIFRAYRGGNSSAVPGDIFRLRHQVYCLECAFLQPEQSVDGMEFDDYDDVSTHFAAFTMDEKLVGAVRLVQPQAPKPYPFELHCEVFSDFDMPDRGQSAEISRLVVKKTHRRRRADSVLGIPGLMGHSEAPPPFDPAVDRRDRSSPMLLLGMYREMFRHSQSHGIRFWYAAMERSLAHALKKMGFRFMAIGPEANYYGAVTPYVLDLHDLSRKLNQSNPTLAAWFNEKPPVVEHSHPSRLHVVRKRELGKVPVDLN
ncbi:PEP-CTERM/exosortase system-associated acyltransferase [Massilia sp. MS-15]|uniref:PEP-CTERM/exosortase system-associated acyltransferase n=1 Tax=Massilia sp. MS-15 TaxID=2878200 RepID=UPI001CD2DBE2|nr:PEP-CTERM/exosortase system-associated acyltransferase [Massilia sp. MS-15]MCA1245509.1 PEP-CTERM/exosortase system-associated acyltransferase [Massilia sp. MS-15]